MIDTLNFAVTERDSISAFKNNELEDENANADADFLSQFETASKEIADLGQPSNNEPIQDPNTVLERLAGYITVASGDDETQSTASSHTAGDEDVAEPDSVLESKAAADDDVLLTGDAMLEQINAANTINTTVNVKLASTDTVVDSGKTVTINAAPKYDIMPIVEQQQTDQGGHINPKELMANEVKNSATIAEKTVTTEQPVPQSSSKSSPAAQLQAVSDSVAALLAKDNVDTEKTNKLLASFSAEQRDQLEQQVAQLDGEKNSTKVNALKDLITQLMSQNTEQKNTEAAVNTKTKNELNVLSQQDKSVLLAKLQDALESKSVEGEQLAQVKGVITTLERDIAQNQLPSAKAQPLVVDMAGSKKTESIQIVEPEIIDLEVTDVVTEEALTDEVAAPINRVQQLFTQLTAISQTAEPLSYEQNIVDSQILQTQQLHSSTQDKQLTLSADQLSAINIIKSDAAKMLQDRVSAMLSINNKEAEIRLDPPEMGSMQIRIKSDAEQAQINFVVQNQQAKEALEQSMPKLRDMLAQQGIDLGESTVSQGDSGSSQAQQDGENGRNVLASQDGENEQNSEQTANSAQSSRHETSSAIDYYA